MNEPKRKFGGKQPGAGRPRNPHTVPTTTQRIPVDVWKLLKTGRPVIEGNIIIVVPRTFEP